MNYFKSIIRFPTGLIILIILISFGIRVYNLNYNSPFLDEAQYIVLGKKVLAGHWQEADPFSWVGGMPLFYPTISAIFSFFGILGSRLFNVILGTVSVFLIYLFSKSLGLSNDDKKNEIIGLISASFLVVLAIPIYLSRLAIYDMLSFSLFLLGLVLLVHATKIKNPEEMQMETRLFLSATAFSLSFLAKYITIISFPFILIWTLYYSKKLGKDRVLLFLNYFAAPLVIATAGYIVWNFPQLLHFIQDQASAPRNMSSEIITQFARYLALPAFFAVFGTLGLAIKRKWFWVFTLTAAAVITPAVHLVLNNFAAAHQHTFLSLIFILPLAGYFLANFFVNNRWIGSVALIVVLGFSLGYSQAQLTQLQSSWPNTNSAMNYLKSTTSNHERVLSFEADVTKLALKDLDERKITGVFEFKYKKLSGETAYQQALTDSFFDLVLFNKETHEEVGLAIKDSFTNHYALVYDEHTFAVYKLNE
ncbi:MAG: hypothetical protein A2Z42_01435 [Candidatus Woykebacteria bacterium RBG_19FT_COMBO_43_10]|uniref:Glycosyltransferase RgtA/B/C/D-like domain-containing protein n=1 Tax=Candidatus Woykebacteria bacterium RBG_19FT_COMBO_43_10 TaxID=1802598 RepID=A0A1G1WFQ2_9BACT|nr:MAG: hypothetical protein A2Z42_01435 [Candidatus Woykebacteria bacterium RBG_19FT_COMBO_43_10]